MMKIDIKEIPALAWVGEWVIHRHDTYIIILSLDLWNCVLEAGIKIKSAKEAQSIWGIKDTLGVMTCPCRSYLFLVGKSL